MALTKRGVYKVKGGQKSTYDFLKIKKKRVKYRKNDIPPLTL